MQRIYFDHNATASLRSEAREAWLEVVDELGGNPSSLHAGGRAARDRIDRARESVAGALGAAEDDVLFTSGGTESNNAALLGSVGTMGPDRALVTSLAEHSSILAVADELERRGHPVLRIGVDRAGSPRLEELEEQLRVHAVGLVSLTAANNEVGALTDLGRVAAVLDAAPGPRPLLHVDAVQALGRLPLGPLDRADLVSFSAHKVGGPVGVGVLLKRSSATLAPWVLGGGQERGLRAGTENAAGFFAASVAIELAVREQATNTEHTRALATSFWSELAGRLPGVRLIGPPLDTPRLPNTLNVYLPGTDGKVLVTRLDLDGLAVSAGSACASGSIEPSHVLRAMGLVDDEARAALRVSFGASNTLDECNTAVEILKKAAGSTRAT